MPGRELEKKLQAAWGTATGQTTVETLIEELTAPQKDRIFELVGAWNLQNPSTPLQSDRVRLRLELRVDYVLPDGTVVLRPNS